MATRKRNEYLEASESEDSDAGYNSEEESKAKALRSSKRQKRVHDSADEDEVDSANEDAEPNDGGDKHIDTVSRSSELARLESLAAAIPSSHLDITNKPISLAGEPKKDKSGIIYLSRCPPFMKPSVLRSLLTPYGPVGRIFLTPESTTNRAQRLKGGGTRRKLFLDGWVEFLKKKDAKFVAENLNAQTMGGKKRSRWHDEVWNIKYLSGVKWSHLVEQIQNENAERQARMRAEISQTKRENQRFLEDIERGKIGKTMEDRKKHRGEAGDGKVKGDEGAEKTKAKAPIREFKQREVQLKGEKKLEPGQDVQRVLSKMF